MDTPEHLKRLPAADTFNYISTWADNAADCLHEIESEYDLGSEYATKMRAVAIECCSQIFAAMMVGSPEAKWRLQRGLDMALEATGTKLTDEIGGSPPA